MCTFCMYLCMYVYLYECTQDLQTREAVVYNPKSKSLKWPPCKHANNMECVYMCMYKHMNMYMPTTCVPIHMYPPGPLIPPLHQGTHTPGKMYSCTCTCTYRCTCTSKCECNICNPLKWLHLILKAKGKKGHHVKHANNTVYVYLYVCT